LEGDIDIDLGLEASEAMGFYPALETLPFQLARSWREL